MAEDNAFKEVKVTVDGDNVKIEGEVTKSFENLLKSALKSKPANFNKKMKKKKMPAEEEIAVIRMNAEKIDVSSATSYGPRFFGFYPFKWIYMAINMVKDYRFSHGYLSFLKVPVYNRMVQRAIAPPKVNRYYKIGELYKNGVVPQNEESKE